MKAHLGYCVQFWSPQLRRDIAAIEREREFSMEVTRLIPGPSWTKRSEAYEGDRTLCMRKEVITKISDRDV